MKKTVTLVLVCLLALALLAGCGGEKLPGGLEAAKMEPLAKELLDATFARDYDKMVQLVSPDGPTAEVWQAEVESHLDAFGPFVEYGEVECVPYEHPTMGDLGVALVETVFENQTVVFQVAFTPDYEIVLLVF